MIILHTTNALQLDEYVNSSNFRIWHLLALFGRFSPHSVLAIYINNNTADSVSSPGHRGKLNGLAIYINSNTADSVSSPGHRGKLNGFGNIH